MVRKVASSTSSSSKAPKIDVDALLVSNLVEKREDGILVIEEVERIKKPQILANIQYWTQRENSDTQFTPLRPTTLTAMAQIYNFQFGHRQTELNQAIQFSKDFPDNLVTIISSMGGVIYYPHPFIDINPVDIISYIARFRNHVLSKTTFRDGLCSSSCLTVRCKCSNLMERFTKDDLECMVDMQRQLKGYKPIFTKIKANINHDNTLDHVTTARYVAMITAFEKLECSATICARVQKHVSSYADASCTNEITKFIASICSIFQKFEAYVSGCTCPRGGGEKIKYKFRKSKKQKSLERKLEIPVPRSQAPGTNCFGSQVTFEVFNWKKLYVSKLFYNGSVQIPGGLESNFQDIIANLKVIIGYLNKYVTSDSFIHNITGIMRNFTCSLVNENYIIRIPEVLKVLKQHRQEKIVDLSTPDSSRNLDIGEYISYINNNDHLTLELKRPYPNTAEKKITVNIKQCGKITIAGSRSQIEADEIWAWLNFFFTQNSAGFLEKKLNPTTGSTVPVGLFEYDYKQGKEIYDDDSIETFAEADLLPR